MHLKDLSKNDESIENNMFEITHFDHTVIFKNYKMRKMYLKVDSLLIYTRTRLTHV